MRKTLMLLMILLAMGWLLGGCSSDETAANDPLPEPTEEDVASQTAYMAVGLVEMAPVALNFAGKADAIDGNYSYVFSGGDIDGAVLLHFEQAGEPCAWNVADYAMASTEAGAPLSFTIFDGGVPWAVGFSLESDIDQGAGTAVVNGSGTLTAQGFSATWTVEDLEVSRAADYPQTGTLTFSDGSITGTLTFNGNDTATVTVGSLSWTVDLGDGSLVEL